MTTKDQPIWKIMKPLMQNYAMYFNSCYGYTGHVFDSRYTSCLIEDSRYFLEVSRYIHLNPVKAAMVRNPLEYEYSSYKYYVNREIEPGIIHPDTSRVLNSFGIDPREQYRIFVEGRISHAEQEMLIMKDIKENEQWLPW